MANTIGKDNPRFTGYEEISGRFWSRLEHGANKRNYEFSITMDYAWNLYLEQNKKCAISGMDIYLYSDRKKITTASIDRKDNNLGYIVGNIQWVHKSVNFMKHSLSQEDLVSFCEKILLNNFKNQNWENYMMLLAKIISLRSKDPSTQCGCVITNEKFRIISCGYNGPIQGIDDSIVPLSRPEKYDWFLHAEENALLFAKKDLQDCYAFITGFPCTNCARMLIQSGISRIYYGTQKIKMCDEKVENVVKEFCIEKGVQLIQIKTN